MGAGRDHDRPRFDPCTVVNLQRVGAYEPGVASQKLLIWDFPYGVKHATDKVVSLALHPLHDGSPIDARPAWDIYAKLTRPCHRVRRLRCSDEKL